MNNHLLQNQVAIVTGGTAGIGKSIALTFAEQGAKVVIFGTNHERGQQVVKQIAELTQKDSALFLPVNVSMTAEVDEAMKKILATYSHVDILVNNAGITRDQLLMKMSEEDWDTVMENNVKSCYNTCHALVRSMMKAKRGKIINMSSVVGLTGNAGQVNYAASKAAIIGLTKALAKELASRGICVNGIAPGFIETPMTEKLTPNQKESILAGIPMGKLGQPQDIAHAALFLASPWADYITGQIISVDGGMVM
jgi:3-oxoacyl-[acyl-carrier protein] reductase